MAACVKEPPFISVCLPVYGTEPLLAQCLRSVFLQDFDSLEHFKMELIDYLDYYNNRRIKLKLKGLTPAQHRYQTLQVA